MSSVHDGFGAAPENAVPTLETLRVGETTGGPTTIAVTNEGDYPVVPRAKRESDNVLQALVEETAVAAEDTGYDGDASELNFTGEALNNTPVVPGSVTIKPTAGGNSVDAKDTNGDGILYTDDDDADACGTINYNTGAVTLSYPSGKDPNTTNITADYSHSSAVVANGGKAHFHLAAFAPGVPEDALMVSCAGLGGASKVRIEAFQSFGSP
jgi:hypothetical protein